jgi:hypothetical protein
MASHLGVGARVVLYINSQPYAQVSGFRWSLPTPKKAIRGLDVITPVELAPTTAQVVCRLNLYRVIGDGGPEGRGITPYYEDLDRGKYFELALVDRQTDLVIFRAQFCAVTNQEWDVPAKGRITGSLSVEALTYTNEGR